MSIIFIIGAAVDIYQREVDQVDPWKKFNEAFTELEKVRGAFSKESDDLLVEAKTSMLDGETAYLKSIKSVYEWSSLAESAVKTYETSKTEIQKKGLVELLKKGLGILKEAIDDLESSSLEFNIAHGKLTSLFIRFGQEFNVNKDFYQQKVKDATKLNINDEIKEELDIVSALNIQAQIVHTFVNSDDVGDLNADEFLKRCREFRKRHSPIVI